MATGNNNYVKLCALAQRLGIKVEVKTCMCTTPEHYYVCVGEEDLVRSWTMRFCKNVSREELEKIAVYYLEMYRKNPTDVREKWGVKKEVEMVEIDEDGNVKKTKEEEEKEKKEEEEREKEEREKEELKTLCAMECSFGSTVTTLGKELEKSPSYKELRELCECLGVLKQLKPRVGGTHSLPDGKKKLIFYFTINGRASVQTFITGAFESPVCYCARYELNALKRSWRFWLEIHGIQPTPAMEEKYRVAEADATPMEYEENGLIVKTTLGEELKTNMDFKKVVALYTALGILHELKYFIFSHVYGNFLQFRVGWKPFAAKYMLIGTLRNAVSKCSRDELNYYRETIRVGGRFMPQTLSPLSAPIQLDDDYNIILPESKTLSAKVSPTTNLGLEPIPAVEPIPATDPAPAPVHLQCGSDGMCAPIAVLPSCKEPIADGIKTIKPRVLQVVINTFVNPDYKFTYSALGEHDCRTVLNATFYTRPDEQTDAKLFVQRTLINLYAQLHAEKSDISVMVLLISPWKTIPTSINNVMDVLDGDESGVSRKVTPIHFANMEIFCIYASSVVAHSLSSSS